MLKRNLEELNDVSYKKQKGNNNTSFNRYDISELIQIKKSLYKDADEIRKKIEKIDDIIKMY
jgi:hypothetical protein